MGIITIIAYVMLIIGLLFFAYINIRYFMDMWEYKHRKKDGSEDHLFKKFD